MFVINNRLIINYILGQIVICWIIIYFLELLTGACFLQVTVSKNLQNRRWTSPAIAGFKSMPVWEKPAKPAETGNCKKKNNCRLYYLRRNQQISKTSTGCLPVFKTHQILEPSRVRTFKISDKNCIWLFARIYGPDF